MRLVMELKPPKHHSKDWRLLLIAKLSEYMKTLPIEDFKIVIDAIGPEIIEWTVEQKRQSKWKG